jgi:hypothetical protein
MAEQNNSELNIPITELTGWNVAVGVVAPQVGATGQMLILFSVIGEDARIINDLMRINNPPLVDDEIIYQLVAYPLGYNHQSTPPHPVESIAFGPDIASYYSGQVPAPHIIPDIPGNYQYWLPGSYTLTIDVTRTVQVKVQVGRPTIFQVYHGRAIASFQL